MRISVIGPVYPFRGGMAHFTTMLSQALDKYHQLNLISFRRQFPQGLYPGSSDKDPSNKPMLITADYLLDPLYPWTWWQAAKKIIDFDSEVVVIQYWTTFWSPAFSFISYILRKKKIKVIYLVHNVLPHEPRSWDPWLARLALKQATSYIVNSESAKIRLESIVPGGKISISPVPIFNMFSEYKISKSDARKFLGLPEDSHIALFFGLVRPYKGLRYLIQAIDLLKRQQVEVFLVIAGEFWDKKSNYLELIDQLGLSKQIRIEDRYIPNEEVGMYFSAADVCVAPYIDGTQSGAIMLAVGFDLPLVVSDIIYDESLVARGYKIFPTSPGDIVSLAKGIQESLSGRSKSSPSIIYRHSHETWIDMVKDIEALVSHY